VAILPVYFLSLEHHKLKIIFPNNFNHVGDLLGVFSGWGFFVFWIGLWISPQPFFNLNPLKKDLEVIFMKIPLTHLMVSSIFLIPALYFGVKGVLELGLKTSETHRPQKIITSGVYSKVRHPQYFGGIFGHISMTFLFSSRFSLYLTPLVILEVLIICLKEEKELIKEFGEKYENYKVLVPMIIPRIRN
jgi:protein-S-isoprenylcysteine O-methyltransferase Ste14